jgi:hypothetical protein
MRYEKLCTRESFGRNKRRKHGDYRFGQENREIQCTKTEPDEHYHPWEDSYETVQIKCKVRRRGRRGMAMPMVGRLRVYDALSVHKAP